ncbi:ATP-binding cassette domain-containing protein [Lacticaseibacillus daqingensis]|uniref:ATP-binding cassette domain-containing protein n=1 Tax=Lacticaseibacillus daqingensis TaxID=2486014 RepID=UPI000F7A2B14|nr:ABC transporter ATP-binding protein [Lacticaseibacillus daqingensis]
MTLTVHELGKTVTHKPVLQAITFAWQPGEIIGLVGRNGAGKTTLMRTLVDQYHADHGGAEIDGQLLATHPALRAQLIYIDPTQTFFARYTLAALGDFYALAYPAFDRQRFAQLAADYDLGLHQRYRELSKGYQALVVMLLTLASNAPYMLLDEPFDGLDLFVREAIVTLVINEVADGTRGFLIASHDLRELDGLADRILFLKRNTISHDYALEDLRQKAVKLQLVFKQPEIPQPVRDLGEILSVRGRVIEALFRDYTPAVEAQLRALEPVLMAPLSLDLTDIFRSEYGRLKEGK